MYVQLQDAMLECDAQFYSDKYFLYDHTTVAAVLSCPSLSYQCRISVVCIAMTSKRSKARLRHFVRDLPHPFTNAFKA